jgi:hypothetical protein
MNNLIVGTSRRACLVVIVGVVAFGSAPSRAEDAASQVKRFEPAVGHWVNEELHRTSPDAPWQQASSEWDIKFMPGGLFVETPGHIKVGEEPAISFVQVYGFDPVNQTYFTRWFSSDGNYGSSLFEWAGRTIKNRGSVVLADGAQDTVRCDFTFDEDFDSAEFACERTTNGKWWVFRKGTGKRIN